jgi:BirA family biotin operon repressor/biotin-[acetyl-CoA-carboxylase] ligase
VTLLEEWHLDTRRLGRRVLVYDRVDSTNTLALALADDAANDGTVILADEQSAGRGQHGRSWQCPPREGVLLSLLLFSPPPQRRPALLAAWVAVSVCQTIQQSTGLEARIKWPNDVLVQGRKVCGILIEQARATVVGIGLNINQSAQTLAQAGLAQATSLALLTGRASDRRQVARSLIEQLDRHYDDLCRGVLGPLEESWRRHCGLLGQMVEVECLNRAHRGRLRDLTWDALVLETLDGEPVLVSPETVRHVVAIQGEDEAFAS